MQALEKKSSNRHVFTVTEITHDIKGVIEDNFFSVWLRGEISNFKSYASGHFYFTLKDEECQIPAVMFKGYNRDLKFQLEDGMQVVVHGRVDVYPPHGKYQLLVDHMEPDGIGALQLAFEQLKEKLEKEGLFADERKRTLPFLPKTVGVVTSAHGAAIHDIISVLKRRFPNIQILLYPVKVQGEGAKEEIVQGIDYFSRTKNADVLIVGRGGGSIEDLWSFNEEDVARAVANCSIPVVSAVGHETDYTICDYVADVRAPTPSVAAEICVPVKSELLATLKSLESDLCQSIQSHLKNRIKHISHLRKMIPSPLALWDHWRLKLGHLEDDLYQNIILYLRKKQYEVAEYKVRIQDPKIKIQNWRHELESFRKELKVRMERYLVMMKNEVEKKNLKLNLLSPKNILQRGYVIVKSQDGSVVTRQTNLKTQDEIELSFYDGKVDAIVTKTRGET